MLQETIQRVAELSLLPGLDYAGPLGEDFIPTYISIAGDLYIHDPEMDGERLEGTDLPYIKVD